MTRSSQKIVLTILILGLCGMFALSIIWRMEDHPLIRQHTVTSQASPTNTDTDVSMPQNTAIMTLMQKMKSDPNNTDTLLELARLFSDQGNTEEAEELLQRALINAPSDSRPPYFMGILFAQQNKWTEAAQQLERSIQLGDDAFARYSLAVIYRYHLNRETDAKVHYETAAKLCNDPALASMIKAELEK